MKKKNVVNASYLIVIFMMLVSCRKAENVSVKPTYGGRYYAQSLIRNSTDARNGYRSIMSLPIQVREADIVTNLQSMDAAMIAIPTVDEAMASRIFQDVLSQGESLWGKYFTDGQYAYCNNVRKYIEGKYPSIVVEKLFVFGDLTAVSRLHGCCASWKYDVTCALKGSNGMVYVIDPRLCSSVVTKDVWIQLHLYPTSCVPHPMMSSQEKEGHLVAGSAFTPLDNIPSGYLVDSGYVYTDIMTAYYSDSVSCQIK